MAKMVWKDKEDLLKESKVDKKNELSRRCHENIISLFEVEIGGKSYGFSYDMEAQTNMQETYQMFQNNVINEINWSARSNEEKIRVTLNKSEFEKVYYEGIKHKQALISKLKDKLEPLVDSAESEEELNSIHWDMEDVDSIKLNIGGTMDKNIQSLEISREMSDIALMEFVNMVTLGMM